jgi:HAD superfamily hydrolase (TIGR01459 family)
MPNTPRPAATSGLSELAPLYRHILCDVWGVVHDGVSAFPAAGEALARFRRGGGRVLLITNAPRPKKIVLQQLDRLGVDRAAYDDVLTSGEASRGFLAARPGIKVLHVGAERDLPLFDGLDVVLSEAPDAELIACTGLFDDETETPEDYDERLAEWNALELPMLCVNPDLVVERGPKLVWCAGAIAARYAAIGGETIVIGKPHAPIYATALKRLSDLAGGPVERSAVLAIGDGVETDVRGAVQSEIDVLFVAGGIHAELFGERGRPAAEAIGSFLAESGLGARAFIPRLVW